MVLLGYEHARLFRQRARRVLFIISGCWMAHRPEPLLLGIGRHRWSDYKDLVRGKRSVRQLLSRYIDSIALGKCHLFWCDFHDGDIWRHGDRLRAVLILDHQGGAAAFLYRAVRHA